MAPIRLPRQALASRFARFRRARTAQSTRPRSNASSDQTSPRSCSPIPNTCGLFEKDIVEIAALVHAAGAYFYCDGANFNAIMGKTRPGDLGVDAMHLNLHKTFSTPHGGGGPGAGPVVLSALLAPFAPVPFLRWEEGGLRLVEHQSEAPQAVWQDRGFPWPDGHVRARLRLYVVARRRRLAAGRRGCRA